MNIAIILLDYSVNSPRRCDAVFDDLKPRRIIDVTTDGSWVATLWHDIVDWVGGYPYEVAAPEEIFDFYRARGFTLTNLKCGGVGLGCNEYVFVRSGERT